MENNNKPASKTILEHAKEIYQDRKEEKERQYGPFQKSIEETATVASILAGISINTDTVYSVLVALKLSRQGHAHKYDNILDGIVYLAAWNDSKEIKPTYSDGTYKPKEKIDFKDKLEMLVQGLKNLISIYDIIPVSHIEQLIKNL